MGRYRKPTVIDDLEGNPGKRKRNKSEPVPNGTPVPPKSISKTAREVWDRVVKSMPPKIYTSADENLLHTYCEWVAKFREASDALASSPVVVPGSTGQLTVSPYLKIMSQASAQMVTIGARLGLDPVSRQHINAPEDVKQANIFLIE